MVTLTSAHLLRAAKKKDHLNCNLSVIKVIMDKITATGDGATVDKKKTFRLLHFLINIFLLETIIACSCKNKVKKKYDLYLKQS